MKTQGVWGLPAVAVLAAGLVVCAECGAASARLTNGNFDLGEVGGVAFEWFFEGDGEPGVQDGSQVLADVPADGVATLFQVVPLCTPGARYRLTCEVPEVAGANTSIWAGLGPKGDPLAEEVVWTQAVGPGVLVVEAEAQEHNVVAYLSVVNPAVEGSPGELARGVFEEARLELAEGVEEPPSIEDTSSPEERQAAQNLYAAGLDLLRHHRPAGADTLFSGIVEELPEARPEAAMALVGMSDAAHFDEMYAYKYAKTERDELLGMPSLRAVLQHYPEQAEACALARYNMGRYYLNMQCLEAAKDQLDRAIEEYPGTEGAMWARTNLINYHIWKSEWDQAEQIYNQVKSAYDQGEATISQRGWAEQFFVGQKTHRLSEGDRTAAYLDHLQDMWLRYRDVAPGLAIYCKAARFRIRAVVDQPRRPYELMNELTEAIEGLPGHLHLTGGLRNALADRYIIYGWKEEHRAEAERILMEVLESEDAAIHHEAARKRLKQARDKRWGRQTPPPGFNVILNDDFDKNKDGEMYHWKLYGDGPNWPDCNWWDDCPVEVGGNRPMAWNSVNCGSPRRMEAWLVAEDLMADVTAPFRASVWVAAEGFLGGDLEDASYELQVSFFNPFMEPLAEFTTGPVPSNGIPKGWQELSIEGWSPEEGYVARFAAYFVADGEGHHAVAMAEPSLIFRGEGNNE